MSELIRLSHNVNLLMYHIVCPAKYRKVVFDPSVDEELTQICQEIELRYDIKFLEIGTDKNHVHFLVQSVPKLSPTQIVRTIKSITARELFSRRPEIKKKLWGGEFWTDGYFICTVGQHGNEETVRKYVRGQGREEEYRQLLKQQLTLG